MYSSRVTNNALDKAEHRLKTKLIRHPLHFVESAVVHFNKLMQEDGNLSRPLTPEERDFIRNERIVSKLDYNYWRSRYCNPPEAPIWMADGSFKSLGNIEVGDAVMGWHKKLGAASSKYQRNFWCTSIVQAVAKRKAPLIRVLFESGRHLLCTPDHLWANGSGKTGIQNATPWVRAKLGGRLRYAVDPYLFLSSDDIRMAGWLAGIFDGEGGAHYGGAGSGPIVNIAQSQSHNPEVCVEIGRVLSHFGIPYKVWDDKFNILGGLAARLRLLRLTNPIRKQKLISTLYQQCEAQQDRIVDIEPQGQSEVISMQTETGNYVAWGYMSKNCWIKNFAGNDYVRFIPNVAQKIMNDICGEMEEEGIAIFIQQLKARQLGVTTDTEMRIAHRVQFYPNVNAVVASSRPEKSEEMSDKMSDCWAREPWWLLPRQTSGRAGSLIEFGDLNSFVSIQHGAQMTGIARGTTPTVVHLSELCEFENPEELVDASLMRAIHHSPFAFVVMESTALGEGNWWHNTWLVSKEGWPTRTADFRPVFLPWFIGADIYPDDTWLRAHPIPPAWEPSPEAAAHRVKCEEFVRVNDLLRRHLGSDWHLPDRQLWWWEVERQIAKKKKNLPRFYMETPADDIEAFQSTNISVFDTDTIQLLRDQTRNPLVVYGFVGNADNFPLRAQPTRHEIDSDLAPIHIKARMNASQPAIECDLVPLRFNGYSTYNEMGKLILWEMPKEGEEYGIGIDTAEGIGQDRTVLEVLRKGTYYTNDAFVGEFASPNMNSIDIFPYAFTLGCFFSTPSSEGSLRRPRMVIECRWNGENVQLELQKRGWPNFHKWTRYHKTKYDLSKERNLGWYSNAWSRPMMMDYFVKAVRDGYLDVYSPYFVEELRHLESSEDSQDARAAYGYHDDRCMAGGIVYFSLHILEMDGTMRPMRAKRGEEAEKQRAPVYVNPFQSRDSLDEVSGADIWLPESYRTDDEAEEVDAE